MGKNATTFKLSLKLWADKAGAQLEALARQAIQYTASYAFEFTPVDTGFLKGNWQPAIGEPNTELNPLGSIGDGPSKLSLVVSEFKLGDKFFYTNNTFYAMFQEYGTVHMAGRFYLQRAVARWILTVDETAKELGIAA